MSKFSTTPGKGFNRNNQQKGPRNAKPKFKVVKKADTLVGFKGAGLFHSKFVPANSGGLMAANRVDGRIVFPERNGLQPQNDGRNWQFQIVGENPKQTVYFARIIDPNASTAVKIFVDKNGKIVCTGRGLLVPRFRSGKAPKMRFAEYRSATPGMGFEPSYDTSRFYADDGYDDLPVGCGCGCDCDCEDDDRTDFGDEVASIWDSLPTKIVNCHSCGFDDCRCDGTGSDWVPARTTLNVLG